MINQADIRVILPAFNEATQLAAVVDEIRRLGYSGTVIVNDGSADGTDEVARQLKVSCVTHPVNLGAGAAVQTGLELARREGWQYVVIMDADGQHDPGDIARLREVMEKENCDIVVGSRFLKRGSEVPRLRILYNFLANVLTNIFTHRNYTDSQSGLRLLNRKAIERINLEINGFGFCSEMLIKAESAGLLVRETPTSVRYTSYSMSKGQDFHMGLNTAFHFLWNNWFK